MFIFYHVSTNVGNFEIILSQKILKHNNMFNKETQRDAFAQKTFPYQDRELVLNNTSG